LPKKVKIRNLTKASFLDILDTREFKMKVSFSKNLVLLIIPLFLYALLVLPVSAVKPLKNTTPPPLPTQAQGKLTEGKLRACQAKEQNIKKRVASLVNLVTNMETKFDSIASRVENYYTSKVVPAGKTVPNYDNFVADIQTKKSAVQTSLTVAQNDANGFSCTASDPKSQLKQFRTDMQAVKAALKNYRTSIRNLIVVVRSLTGEIERGGSITPKPTKAEKEND
jgi:peptidoglycan hydrolase CwlO-like protein